MAREAKLSLVDAAVALPYLKSGELRVLALTSTGRNGKMPEVPTVAESGVPGYSASVDLGFFAPTGTPQPIFDRPPGRADRGAPGRGSYKRKRAACRSYSA
jgi:tripartite-type tricarboxylate transporter receptor subunit TctC